MPNVRAAIYVRVSTDKQTIIGELDRLGVALVSASEPWLDTSGPSGVLRREHCLQGESTTLD